MFLKSPLVNIRDPYHQQDAMKVLPLNKPGNAGFANLTYMNTTKHDSRTIWGPQLPSARCGLEGSFRPLGFRIRRRGAERYDKRHLVFDSKMANTFTAASEHDFATRNGISASHGPASSPLSEVGKATKHSTADNFLYQRSLE